MSKLALIMGLVLCMAGCASVPPAPSAVPSESPAEYPVPTPVATPGETPPADTPEPVIKIEDFFYAPPDLAPEQAEIRVYKSRRAMELVLDGEVAGRFPVGLGPNPVGDKEKEGDGRTPTGEYYVCTRNTETRYYLSLGVSYPNTEDARRGLDSGLITQQEYDRIAAAQEEGRRPDWDTALGGAICIHSGGSRWDWTAGCIATDDDTMDALWEYCAIGTPIFIYE